MGIFKQHSDIANIPSEPRGLCWTVIYRIHSPLEKTESQQSFENLAMREMLAFYIYWIQATSLTMHLTVFSHKQSLFSHHILQSAVDWVFLVNIQ